MKKRMGRAAMSACGAVSRLALAIGIAVAPAAAQTAADAQAAPPATKQFFGTAENPGTVARSTIQVAALAGPAFLVEIEATAAK